MHDDAFHKHLNGEKYSQKSTFVGIFKKRLDVNVVRTGQNH